MVHLQWIIFFGFFGSTLTNPLSCHYKGTEYVEGDTILIDTPCLSCTCRSGALDCALRVCPQLPNPPPSGCIILHKKDSCCPQLICEDQGAKRLEIRTEPMRSNLTSSMRGCLINGTLYSEGSAMLSSRDCEYCYCMQSQSRCMKPHCPMPQQGCIPSYSENSCCPTHYNCTASPERVEKKITPENVCSVNGTLYFDGDMIPTPTACETCYCMDNRIKCAAVQCTIQHLEGCYPVYTPDKCCPLTYNCTKPRRSEETRLATNKVRSLSTQHNNSSYQNTTEVPDQPTTPKPSSQPQQQQTQTAQMESQEGKDEELQSTTIRGEEVTTELDVNVTEVTPGAEETDTDVEMTTFGPSDVTTEVGTTPVTDDTIDNTTNSEQEETTISSTDATVATTTASMDIITAPSDEFSVDVASNLRLDVRNRTQNSEEAVERAQPMELDDLLANATRSDEDYDAYDYTEPRLPPSLPNLVIFPFVAADAVTEDKQPKKDEQVEQKTDEDAGPVYYKHFFSPPVETEGGFVPKDDSETVTYDTSYFNEPIPDNHEDTPPSITMPPKAKTELCVSEGKEYRHGELTSTPGDCISCVCFYGEVICQEANCPTPPAGCVTTADKEENFCCGKISCGPENVTMPIIFAPNGTEVELEPLVVSDKPFSDVIRTEPAPDLPSLMSEILPFLLDQQTHKPVSVNYKNKVVNYYPKHQITTTNDDARKTTMMIEETPLLSSTESYDIVKIQLTSASPVYQQTQKMDEYHFTTEYQWEKATEIPSQKTTENVTAETPVHTSSTEEIGNSIATEATIQHFKVTTKKPTTPKQSSTKTSLLGLKPKPVKESPTSTTTEADSESFLDEFLKGFFESNNDVSTTTLPSLPKFTHKYSSKIRGPPVLPTTTMPSVQVIENREGEETETNSFSLDSVLHMLFNAETTEGSTIRVGTKPKNSTVKYTRKPVTRKTKRPLPVTTPMTIVTERIQPNVTINSTQTTENATKIPTSTVKTSVVSESSFVTDQDTGFPKINILQQELRKINKVSTKNNLENLKGVVSKQPESSRKPIKAIGGLGAILKLAGCNIYGRMYRVGKIITELSNPCLECMCTDSGVQCSKIVC